MSVPALVKKELLRWGRTSAHLTEEQLAAKMQVDREDVIAWEDGRATVTLPRLKKLAEKCRRPLAVFYLDAPPKDFDAARLPDFRRLPDGSSGVSPELAFEVRRAHHDRALGMELADEIGFEVPSFGPTASLHEPTEQVAARLRTYLGVSIATQHAWKDDHEALRSWIEALDRQGVLVFRMSLPLEEARGFSIDGDRLPAIVLNAKEPPAARVFTLLHELAHLALRQSGVCDLHEGRDASSTVEVFCNAVAGAVAVPSNALRSEPELRGRREDADWNEPAFVSLARRYHVSREVVARRLLSIGAISSTLYGRLHARWNAQIAKSIAADEKTGFEAPSDKALRTHGKLFTSLVFASRAERLITTADVASYLDVRVTHLEAIERGARS